MPSIVIGFNGRTWTFHDGDVIFGRSADCDVVIGAGDQGVSRKAGRLSGREGLWTVANLSEKRVLYITGPTMPSTTLSPVVPDGRPLPRPIGGAPMTVLVPGDNATYELALALRSVESPSLRSARPEQPTSTQSRAPVLTDGQREVMAELARAYLAPPSGYRPRPAPVAEVAAALRLSESHVLARVRAVRAAMEKIHLPVVPEDDPMLHLDMCELLVALHVLTSADLEWLRQRTARGFSAVTPADLARAASPLWPSSEVLAQQPHARVMRSAERVAGYVRSALEARLREFHGPRWIDLVNRERERRGKMRVTSLDDPRFTLSLLAENSATDSWAPDVVRTAARKLLLLANDAHHNRPMRADAVDTAAVHAENIRHWMANRPR